MLKMLFLTNNDNSLKLYNWLKAKCNVILYSEKLSLQYVKESNVDIIISYNYKYMVAEDIIRYMEGKILNLHISYLPWNKGADPNIWSFLEDTPKGVTIHQMSTVLDEGKILYQKKVELDIYKESFVSSYSYLQNEIVKLFQEHWNEIKNGTYCCHEQVGEGSYHTKKDLKQLREKFSFCLEENVAEVLQRYKKLNEK